MQMQEKALLNDLGRLLRQINSSSSFSITDEDKLSTQFCHLLLLYLQKNALSQCLDHSVLQNLSPKANQHFYSCFSACCKKKRESFKRCNCGLYQHCYFCALVSFLEFKLKMKQEPYRILDAKI